MNSDSIELIHGLELYNQGEFWECHEVLERLWKVEPNPSYRLFLWIVIQVSGAFVLESWGRTEASSRLFTLAQEKARRLVRIETPGEHQMIPPRWSEFVNLVRNSERLQSLSQWKFESLN